MSNKKANIQGGLTIRKLKHRYLVDKSGRIATIKTSQDGSGCKTSRRRPQQSKDFEGSPVLC